MHQPHPPLKLRKNHQKHTLYNSGLTQNINYWICIWYMCARYGAIHIKFFFLPFAYTIANARLLIKKTSYIGGAHNCGTSMWVLLANTKHASHAHTHGGGGRKSFSVAPAFRFALMCVFGRWCGARCSWYTRSWTLSPETICIQPAPRIAQSHRGACVQHTRPLTKQTHNLKARVPFAPGPLISPHESDAPKSWWLICSFT